MSGILAAVALWGLPPQRGDEQAPAREILQWSSLPGYPDPVGVGGPFAGLSNGALIVAGGARFPSAPPWEGGRKVWTDAIHVLDSGQWRSGFKLDRPLAYGASVSASDGAIFLGGQDAERAYASVSRMRWKGDRIERAPLPDLPRPCTLPGAALLGGVLYVAGGQDSVAANAALKNFWALNLDRPDARWEILEPWPGPARVTPIVVAQDGALYVMAGSELLPAGQGTPGLNPPRRFLTDAYRYKPGIGWKRVRDLPRPASAAPAIAFGPSHILVFGGDDGTHAHRISELKDAHPGFPRDLLSYHTITNTWTRAGTLPEGLVTTTAVRWGEAVVLPSGENRPGRRSAAVHRAFPAEAKGHFAALDYAVVSGFLLAMVGIGVYSVRGERNTHRYFLAGGHIPWWAAGLSIFGAQLSAITFLSIPAKVYATDWVYVLHNLAVALVAPIVIFFYLGFYCRLKVTSAYEYLERRFNLAARLFGSTSFVLYQLIRMSMQMYLPALLLSTVLGFDIYACILVIGLTSTLYCMLGGAEAVVWTEVVQGVLLLGSALLSLGIIVASVEGGLGGILEVGRAEGKFHVFDWTWDMTTTTVWVVLGGSLLQHLVPYTSDQAVIQRYMTTRDERQAARSIWINNVALTLVATVLFFGVGTALFVFYRSKPELLNPALSTDAIFPLFMTQALPPGVLGLVVAGLLSASMSGGINAIATVIVTDFYRRFRPHRPDRSYLRAAVTLTAVLGLFATMGGLILAGLHVRSVWDVFLRILGLFGGSLAGLFTLGIFTRRATGAGAVVGALAGAAATFCVQSFTAVHFFLYAGTGILATVGVGYLASLILPSAPRNLRGLTLYDRSESAHGEPQSARPVQP